MVLRTTRSRCSASAATLPTIVPWISPQGTQEKESASRICVGCGCGRERIMREIENALSFARTATGSTRREVVGGERSLRSDTVRGTPTPRGRGPSSSVDGRSAATAWSSRTKAVSRSARSSAAGSTAAQVPRLQADTQARRRDQASDLAGRPKKTLRCTACGFSDFRALEFHHPDAQEKDFAIGEMVKDNRSIAAIEREMARCVALCQLPPHHALLGSGGEICQAIGGGMKSHVASLACFEYFEYCVCFEKVVEPPCHETGGRKP